MKKKICTVVLSALAGAVLVLGVLFVLNLQRPVKLDCGESDIFTEEEISAAAYAVALKFDEFKGCRLLALTYAGDEISKKESTASEDGSNLIVFNSVFLSPFIARGAWNSNEIYTWTFTLSKQSGVWTVINYGYG